MRNREDYFGKFERWMEGTGWCVRAPQTRGEYVRAPRQARGPHAMEGGRSGGLFQAVREEEDDKEKEREGKRKNGEDYFRKFERKMMRMARGAR
jgi:hypothetical protein